MKSEEIFNECLRDTLKAEGGYCNISGDNGGETYKGISRNNFPQWSGWRYVDEIKENVKSVSELNSELECSQLIFNSVSDFYQKEFFVKLKLNEINSLPVVREMFDTAVNCGKRNAIKFVQRACNFLNNNEKNPLFLDLEVDGVIGKKTINAISYLIGHREKALLISLNGEQYCYYSRITERRPEFEKFFAGWMKRVNFTH